MPTSILNHLRMCVAGANHNVTTKPQITLAFNRLISKGNISGADFTILFEIMALRVKTLHDTLESSQNCCVNFFSNILLQLVSKCSSRWSIETTRIKLPL